MTNSELKTADAIREVTAKVQKAVEEGFRSRAIDADDLLEVLLAIADRLDPPVPGNLVDEHNGCRACGERDADRLVWQADDELVRCATCGALYRPGG